MPAEAIPRTLGQIAALLGGQLHGDPDLAITGPTGLEDAVAGSMVRVDHPKHLAAALASEATALLCRPDLEGVTKPSVRVDHPKVAFARLLAAFDPETRPVGIHRTAVLAPDVVLDVDCAVGAYAVIGAGTRLGKGVAVHSHVSIGAGCEIGEGSVLFPGAVLYDRTVIGARVRIHSGAVIGADGFGYEPTPTGLLKIPQIGRVRIEDDVEVGANSTIDRATTGETVIGAGSKIDNQVQVAHNVRTGRYCILVSQVGVAGSTRLGNGVVLGGQAGVKDHVEVGDGVQAAGRSGIWGDQPAGAKVAGHPARPYREEMRINGALTQLPELLKRVKELERRLAAVEKAPEQGLPAGND